MENSTNKQLLSNSLKVSIKALMEMHPSQRESAKMLVDKIDAQSLSAQEILQEMKRLGASFIQAKDRDNVDFRMLTTEVAKSLAHLRKSPHLSSKQKQTLDAFQLNDGFSPAEALKGLNQTCQVFANDALHLREQSSVVVGESHKKLKKDDTNIIAGDVAWSSKQILKSITPLLQRTQQEHPDCPSVTELYNKSKALNSKSVVDFFEAVAVMEDGLRAITRLQGKRNDAEADYLKTFHQHLKSIHQTLDSSIRQNATFEKASKQEQDALLGLMNNFKDASDHETDPNKLKKLIAENVSSMKNGFQKIMEKQDTHIRQQQRTMDNLRSEAREYEKKSQRVHAEKERLYQALENIEMLSIVDELTQTPNRRAYDNAIKAIDESMLNDSTSRERHGIIVIDIDHFKSLNDTYGHQLGDKALSSVSGLLSRLIKSSKTLTDNAELYRYGGEEFVIVYRNLTFKDAVKLAEGLRSRVEALGCKIREETLKITVSMGVAAFSNNDRIGAQVFEFADKAMYDAKRNGRNQVYAYQQGKNIAIKRKPYIPQNKK